MIKDYILLLFLIIIFFLSCIKNQEDLSILKNWNKENKIIPKNYLAILSENDSNDSVRFSFNLGKLEFVNWDDSKIEKEQGEIVDDVWFVLKKDTLPIKILGVYDSANIEFEIIGIYKSIKNESQIVETLRQLESSGYCLLSLEPTSRNSTTAEQQKQRTHKN